MDDKLNSLLNDPEKMKAAFEMASQIVGQNPSTQGTPPPKINTDDLSVTFQKMRESGALDSILSSLSSQAGGGMPQATPNLGGAPQAANVDVNANATATPNPAASAAGAAGAGGIAAMLPNILQMMNGSSDGLNSDRTNLLNAIKPYINDGRAGSIDRAVNVAGMAKNAKSMLGFLKK